MNAILKFEIFMTYTSLVLAVHAVNFVVVWKYEARFPSHKVMRGVSLRATPGLTVL